MGFHKFATSWDELTGKPTTFPTDWASVAGKPTVFPSDWAIVSNKPANLAQLASFEFWDEISFTTLNATFQNVWSVTLALNEVASYEIDLLGRRQGTNEIWYGKYTNAFVNNVGVLTQVGNQQNFLRKNMITNPVIQTQIVGTTLQFRVHSGTTQAINWKAKIHLYKTTLP